MRPLLIIICCLFYIVSAAQTVFCGEPIPDGPMVHQKLLAALHRRRHVFENVRFRMRMDLYLPYIRDELAAHGLPADLQYVPMVESRLTRGAASAAGATGCWQFMKATGSMFGLSLHDGVDDRRLVMKSTPAACKYLRRLYGQFGSWPLVLAAYNMGEGGVAKALRRQGVKDYFSLRLNAETAEYVYEVIALKILYESYKSCHDVAVAGFQHRRPGPGSSGRQ